MGTPGAIGPAGIPLWVSAVLPGSTHDITAARELVLPETRPYLKNCPCSPIGVRRRWRRSPRPGETTPGGELDIDTQTRNTLLRAARYQGERAFALMSQRWRAIRRVIAHPARSATSPKPPSSSPNSSTNDHLKVAEKTSLRWKPSAYTG